MILYILIYIICNPYTTPALNPCTDLFTACIHSSPPLFRCLHRFSILLYCNQVNIESTLGLQCFDTGLQFVVSWLLRWGVSSEATWQTNCTQFSLFWCQNVNTSTIMLCFALFSYYFAVLTIPIIWIMGRVPPWIATARGASPGELPHLRTGSIFIAFVN